MEHLHMISLPRRRMATLPFALLLALLALTLLGPASALARGGGGGGGGDRPEVRVGGSCGRGASSTLKLKARDGGIEAEFEVHGRSRSAWSVAFVQERRTVWRGRARAAGVSHSFSIERRLGDYPGPDQVFARAVGPRGMTCQATATLPG
jgi:hypothetical protein